MTDSFAQLVWQILSGERAIASKPLTRLDNTGTKRHVGYTKTKVIISGSITETYQYEFPIRYGSSPKKKQAKRTKSIRSEEYRKSTIVRAINTVRQLSCTNFTLYDKFLTYTFDPKINNINLFDPSSCLPFYQKAMRRMRKKYPDIKYITVTEFQKSGRVHYHTLCNIPYISKSDLNTIWSYGFTKAKAIKGTTHLALYLVKYMSKRFADSRKLGHRLFYTSHNLKKPKTIYLPVAEDLCEYLNNNQAYTVKYENQYPSAHNGLVSYKQYQSGKNRA